MTRMWMVNPKIMCRQHLLGEHKEIHQLVGLIQRLKISQLKGHLVRKQVTINCFIIAMRHDELVKEMINRNYNHKTELLLSDIITDNYFIIKDKLSAHDLQGLNVKHNLSDLLSRCKNCSEKLKNLEVSLRGVKL